MQEPSIPLLVYSKYHWFSGFIQEILKETEWADLTRPHLAILGGVRTGETRPSRLAVMIGVSRQAASKTIKELEERKLLTLQQDPDQKNSKVIVLTKSGQSCSMTIAKRVSHLMERLTEEFGAQAIESTIAILGADWATFMKQETKK